MKNRDSFYMDIARRCGAQSYATRRQVGCVITKGDNIISFGWNGMPAGYPNTCEDETNKTLPEVSHAEMNAVGKLAEYGVSSAGATLYCTASPCIECAKLIQRTGILEVVYADDYHSEAGLYLLQRRGIVCRKL